MPKYVIEQYEIHIQRYEVEASSEGEAIAELLNGNVDSPMDCAEYVETADSLGMPVQKCQELARQLRELGVFVGQDVIPSSAASRGTMLEIVARGHRSFGGGVLWHQKLEGQVMKCRWFGLVFYVRENLDGSLAFHISANQRQGDKGGTSGYGRPTLARNILDVCTPRAIDWAIAADVVRSLDRLDRPVRHHRLFTPAWAESLLATRPIYKECAHEASF